MISRESNLVVALVDGGKAALANVTDNDIRAEFLVATVPGCLWARRGMPRRRWCLLHSQGRRAGGVSGNRL